MSSHLPIIAVSFLMMQSLVADFLAVAKQPDAVVYLINQDLPVPPDAEAFRVEQQLLGPALNVTVHSGQDALLTCVAPHLGEKTVSWIRQKDLAILVSGRHVYTSDHRVASVHPDGSDLWGLQISQIRPSDEGLYQCQVNTEPKLSRTIALIVLDQDPRDSPTLPAETSQSPRGPKISLKVSGSAVEAEEGSSVNLSCSATLQAEKLSLKHVQLSWWHEHSPISERLFQGRTAGVEITQVFGAFSATSHLKIKTAQRTDTGNYYCRLVETGSLKQTNNQLPDKDAVVNLRVLPRKVTSSSLPRQPRHQLPVLLLLLHCLLYLTR